MGRFLSPGDASLLALLAENPNVSAKDAAETVAAIESPTARKIAGQLAKRLPIAGAKASTRKTAEALKSWAIASRSSRSRVLSKSRKKR
jgi:hypothetical protein